MRAQTLDEICGQDLLLLPPVLLLEDQPVQARHDALDLAALPGLEDPVRKVKQAALDIT